MKPEEDLSQDHNGVLERIMCVITADCKDIPDPIVKTWYQTTMQAHLGHEEGEMTWGLRVVSNQEVKIMIQEWWT